MHYLNISCLEGEAQLTYQSILKQNKRISEFTERTGSYFCVSYGVCGTEQCIETYTKKTQPG